jgi:hypothetical protein
MAGRKMAGKRSAAAKTATTKTKKPTKTVSQSVRVPAGWRVLKNGTLRKNKWCARNYLEGWFLYTTSMDNVLGPYDSLKEGLLDWRKQRKKQ